MASIAHVLRKFIAHGAAPAILALAPAASDAQAIDRGVAVATFDSVWRHVRNTHYDPSLKGVDWERAREELRPLAEASANGAELREVLEQLLARLGDSHYGVLPGDVERRISASGSEPAADSAVGGARASRDREETSEEADEKAAPGDVGAELRLVNDRATVVRVDSGGPAWRAGVRPGWIVDAVDGRPVAPRIAAAKRVEGPGAESARLRLGFGISHLLDGAAGSSVSVRVLDARDRARTVSMRRRASAGDVVKLGNLPPMLAALEHRELHLGDGCVGFIRFNLWMTAVSRPFDEAVDRYRGCRGMIVDVRGNPGGVAAMVMGLAGHFVDTTAVLGTMRSRLGTLRFVANPRRSNRAGQSVEPFDGPLAILVDGLSVSTSEFFAAGLGGIGRARIFGERTAGQALPAYTLRLPSGDVLMYVAADFTGPNDRRIEAVGVQPDVATPLTRRALLAGRDPALDSALRWISEAAPER